VSKLAFLNRDDAIEFSKKYRGKIVTFKDALSLAQNSLSSDMAVIKRKKEKKIYPMGKKIVSKMCSKDIELSGYSAINELKSAIKKEHLCRAINEKQLQMAALYLWEVKRVGEVVEVQDTIKIDKKDKNMTAVIFYF